MKNLFPKKLKGSVLGFSLMLLTLLLVSSLTLVSVAIVERKTSFSTQKSVIAFQAADSASERVLALLYKDNSPTLATVPLNGTMPDSTLNSFANSLCSGPGSTCSSANCSGGTIEADNRPTSSSPDYTFAVTFHDLNGALISCGDNQWRDKTVSIRSEGFFQRTSRVIEIGIRPRE